MPDDILGASASSQNAPPSQVPTSSHPVVPPSPGLVARALAQPMQSGTLASVLILALITAVGGVRGENLEDKLAIEIERRDEIAAQKDLWTRAAVSAEECAAAAEVNAARLEALAREDARRDDDQYAFQAEIAQYVGTSLRAFAAKLKVEVPPPGPRYDDFVTIGTLRGSRDGHR